MPPATKRPKDSPFKQQTLKAWRPVLTPRLVILLFSTIGLAFLPIGIAIIVTSNQIEEVESTDYSAAESAQGCCVSNCDAIESWTRIDRNPCTVTIEVPSRMEPPIYMYYKLTNFYQNHRRYVRSRDDVQLKGDDASKNTFDDLEDACEYHYSVNTSSAAGDAPGTPDLINPCGLIAWSYFNDSFVLSNSSGDVPLDETGIAWQSDLEEKFHNHVDGSTGLNFPPFAWERSRRCDDLNGTQHASLYSKCKTFVDTSATPTNLYGEETGWCFPGSGMCTEDPHFVIWMRTAGLPTFRKLYAKINAPLEAGTYHLQISSGVLNGSAYLSPQTDAPQPFLYPVGAFGGTKRVVLSTASWIGGKNFFLGYAYVVVGVICLVLAICFFVKHRLSPREPGTADYVSYQQGTPK